MSDTDLGVPTEAEVLGYFERLSNWGRWGEDDQRGTLNTITPQKRVEAAGLVESGEVVSCAWDIDFKAAVDHVTGTPQRFMLATGQGLLEPGRVLRPEMTEPPRWAGASEHIGLAFHGYSVTHLDALSHYFWDGQMYNGKPAAWVSSREGATWHAMNAVPEGIVTRGVLLDVAAARGVDWLEPGEGVLPADIAAAERRQGVAVERGDAVLLRTGYGKRKRQRGPDDTAKEGRAGWHVACTPWMHQREVAMIGCDTAQDVHPSGYDQLRSPVHAVGIVAMGLWLLDNCDLEGLAEVCEAKGRWEFLFQLAPLRLAGVTGSPVNPLAMF